MPMTDLVRFLNTRNDSPYSGKSFSSPFVATDKGVVIHFANLRLSSHFLPILDTNSGVHHGHAATLRVTGQSNGQVLNPEAVFVLPSNDREFVYLDRLVRTLHALNYLTHSIRGKLLLKVHQRHVLSVPADHGLAFEELLRQCGLAPDQVTLEIDADDVEDLNHLFHAIRNYQSRGYGIAISRFGHSSIDFTLLKEISPDIVKLDPHLLASSRPLKRLIGKLHELGTKVLVEGIDTAAMRKGAAANDIDLLLAQGILRRVPDTASETPPAGKHWSRPTAVQEQSPVWAVAASA